jgi:squalene/oxidosqualene cyclase-like protein
LPEGPLADRAGSVLSGPEPVTSEAAERDDPPGRALGRLLSLQRTDGSWEGEVVWCTMILSQYVIVRHIVSRPIDAGARLQILRHYAVTRTAEGGWPLHPEGPPQVFTTAIAYVAIRLLGVSEDDELVAPAREWLLRQPDGVLGIPTWGKFWLALIGLYGWAGVSALPPELFVMPRWLPFHPRRWYCHTRYIYLAMVYLSGRGFSADLGALGESLRRELYAAPYHTIDFAGYRNHVAASDLHARGGLGFSFIRHFVLPLTGSRPSSRRSDALADCFERIVYEQRVTRYQALSPVNGLLNAVAIFATDPAHPALEPSLAGLEAWKWSDAAAGIRYAGARSQVWDTAFAARAICAAMRARPVEAALPRGTDVVEALRRAHTYLIDAQLREELPDRDAEYREAIRGGWCFSDGAHRWPVGDCTAEALSAILDMESLRGVIADGDRITQERVADALTFLLARQNADGGFSTYEPIRGARWLDRLNPSEMFRDCMSERSYVECTASAVEALALVRRVRKDLWNDPAAHALSRAMAFLRRTQRADGSWAAAWGINFTYAIFHATKALAAAGVEVRDPARARAASWLREKQRADGGWGEHFSSCLTGEYVEHASSQPVMTSWALLALADDHPSAGAVERGGHWLQSTLQPDGSWPAGAVNGVFFGTAMLDYRLYQAYFPLWALARVSRSRQSIARVE